MNALNLAVISLAGLILSLAPPSPGQSQSGSAPRPGEVPSVRDGTWPAPVHRVVIQVTQNDPAIMNMALNNAENLVKHYQDKGEKIQVEFVAYGAGLAMMRGDTSPVKDRLAAIGGRMKNITFSGCGNTLATQSRQENQSLSLVPEARVVATGIGRIVELEEQGWTYVRP